MAWHVVTAPNGLKMVTPQQGYADEAVLAIAWEDERDETRYLVARKDAQAEWVEGSEAGALWIR